MEPISLIMAALAFCGPKLAEGVLGEAAKDAYDALKNLIISHSADKEKTQSLIDDHAADPDTWEKPLQKTLEQSGVTSDNAVLGQAKAIMQIADPAGSSQGKYNVIITGGQNIVGDRGTQNNYFGAPPSKSDS